MGAEQIRKLAVPITVAAAAVVVAAAARITTVMAVYSILIVKRGLFYVDGIYIFNDSTVFMACPKHTYTVIYKYAAIFLVAVPAPVFAPVLVSAATSLPLLLPPPLTSPPPRCLEHSAALPWHSSTALGRRQLCRGRRLLGRARLV